MGRLTLALAMLAVLLAAACNPYRDVLPEPRCRARRDCLPGARCEEQRCRLPVTLTVRAPAGAEPLHVWVVAAPHAGAAPLDAPATRSLAAATLETRASALVREQRFEQLPELPAWVLAWYGDEDGPSEGEPHALVRVPGGSRPSLTLLPRRPWSISSPSRPPPLGYADHPLFADR